MAWRLLRRILAPLLAVWLLRPCLAFQQHCVPHLRQPHKSSLAQPPRGFLQRHPSRLRPQVVRQALPTLLAAGAAAALLLRQAAQRLGSRDSALRNLISRHTNVLIVDEVDPSAADEAESPEVPPPVISGESGAAVHWYAQREGLPPVRWVLKRERALQRVLLEGGLGFAESYMDGDWETDDLERLIYEMLKLENVRSELGWRVLPLLSQIFWGALKWKIFPGNSLSSAKSNIANTYDVLNSPKLYEIMLGPTMQYTCAYFHRPDMTLDEAQQAKMDLIARKLDLKPGMKCLEFGFGFGAQANYLASKYGVLVTGVTLSKEQMAWASENNSHPNVEFRFQDYRQVEGKFDRIYSVGMFEHVGRNSYKAYFDKCYELLADDGIMMIHTMGWARRGPWNHNAFVNKYIFPGGEMPTMMHLTQEFSDRWHMEDWQSFGKSYVQTLRCWLDKIKDWKDLDELDMRFRRMWVYYLCACAAAFERRRVKLWQIVYTKLAGTRPDDCLHIRAPSKSVSYQ
eukprot:TRINITY_DN60727_c0_g1_i1.p1 TRINITY_DN60727_c0_g1~~TRINITY_DN60727_c0_g1_i1.p1  ORF type:complete len:520 (-),score=92.81 TRINITY_DN60727_c0_g1_i1:24-1562(-)